MTSMYFHEDRGSSHEEVPAAPHDTPMEKMTHVLRTALTKTQLLINLGERQVPDYSRWQDHRQIQTALWLAIENLLATRRIAANEWPDIGYVSTNIATALPQILRSLPSHLQQRIQLAHALFEIQICIPEDHFRLMILNLVDNGLRYTNDPLQITYRWINDQYIYLILRSGAPGLPFAIQAQQYRPYIQTEHGQTLGLGLHVSYHLAMYYGRWRLRTTLDGTTIGILLSVQH